MPSPATPRTIMAMPPKKSSGLPAVACGCGLTGRFLRGFSAFTGFLGFTGNRQAADNGAVVYQIGVVIITEVGAAVLRVLGLGSGSAPNRVGVRGGQGCCSRIVAGISTGVAAGVATSISGRIIIWFRRSAGFRGSTGFRRNTRFRRSTGFRRSTRFRRTGSRLFRGSGSLNRFLRGIGGRFHRRIFLVLGNCPVGVCILCRIGFITENPLHSRLKSSAPARLTLPVNGSMLVSAFQSKPPAISK